MFPDARLIGDDYDHDDVSRAVNEFAQRIDCQVEVLGSGWRAWRIIAPRQQSIGRSSIKSLTSIIIVTYNEIAYTRECLESIRLRTDEPYELILIDNGSLDGTPAYLESIAGAKVILNQTNRGFPAAVNQGIQIAQGEFILLLNNDTVVTTGWMQGLLETFERDPRIGLVGPCSNRVSGSQMITVPYTEMTSMDGFAWDWRKLNSGKTEETDRLIGFCLMIRKAVINQIGLLDERFGIGCFEDDDICLRAIHSGWKAVIARDVFIHHYGSRTFAASGVDFGGLLDENRQKFREKWESNQSDKPSIGKMPAFEVTMAPGGGLALGTVRPRLSLCMIVRNNETTIRPCLESIRPWVDEMIVVDTGSTDATPQICENLGARVIHWAWRDDFSAARNQSLDHATGEWIFWMDSDDTISEDCGRKLRNLADGEHAADVLGYVIQVHCPGPESDGTSDVTAVDHVKLIRNRPDLRFEHRIHEQILPAIRRAGGEVEFTEIYVTHSGSDHSEDGRARKLERDYKLLELDLKERPNHPFVLFNLGMTCADDAKYDQAIDWLTRCLNVSSPLESHVRKAYALLISSLHHQSRFNEADKACKQARNLYSGDKELLFRQAMLDHHLGRLEEAVQHYNEVLDVSIDRHFSSIDLGITGFKTRHNLALVYEDQKDYLKAQREWQNILKEHPEYHPASIGLTECLLQLGEHEPAARRIEAMFATPKCAADAYRLSAKQLEMCGDDKASLTTLQQGIDAIGPDPKLLRELARLYYSARNLRSAYAVLSQLIQITPNDRSALNNLHVVQSELAQSSF